MERMRVGRDEITFRVTAEASNGALLAADVALPAGGGPPAMHRHDPDEVYRIDSGRIAIYLEDEAGETQRIDASAGTVVHIPGGRAHTVRNESDAEAHAFVTFVPGGDMERFLRAAGELASPDPQQVLELAERHGIEMTGPVPLVTEPVEWMTRTLP